jgi:hypothetical protein
MQDSVRRFLLEELRRKRKIIAVVNAPEAADIVLELKTVEKLDQFFYDTVLTLKVGDEPPIEMERVHTELMMTGILLGDAVEEWVRDNELRVLASRRP